MFGGPNECIPLNSGKKVTSPFKFTSLSFFIHHLVSLSARKSESLLPWLEGTVVVVAVYSSFSFDHGRKKVYSNLSSKLVCLRKVLSVIVMAFINFLIYSVAIYKLQEMLCWLIPTYNANISMETKRVDADVPIFPFTFTDGAQSSGIFSYSFLTT